MYELVFRVVDGWTYQCELLMIIDNHKIYLGSGLGEIIPSARNNHKPLVAPSGFFMSKQKYSEVELIDRQTNRVENETIKFQGGSLIL